MTKRTWPLVLALAVVVLALGAMSFNGGFGLFHAPAFQTEVSLPQEPTPSPSTEPTQPVDMPCNGHPGNPVIYYANDPSASQYNDFGKPLDPNLSPLDEPHGTTPNARQIVLASWNRFCHDPALTRAVVAAAFPTWNGLNQSFDWTSALNKLDSINWDQAVMVYYTTTPTPWTMMMVHNTSDAPTTYITPAHHAGWYLRLAVDDSHTLLIRPGCGDQPSLNLTSQGYSQAALTRFFRVS